MCLKQKIEQISDHLIHLLPFFCSPVQIKCPNYPNWTMEISFLSPLLCFILTVLWFIYMCYIDINIMLANERRTGFSLWRCSWQLTACLWGWVVICSLASSQSLNQRLGGSLSSDMGHEWMWYQCRVTNMGMTDAVCIVFWPWEKDSDVER